MTTYTLTVTEDQRRQVAEALAMLVNIFTNASVQVDAYGPQERYPCPICGLVTYSKDSYVRHLEEAKHSSAPSAPPAPPAVATVDKPQSRDRWARDRSGNEVPNPKGHYTVSVHVFKAERDDVKNTGAARMKVAFDSPTGKGTVEAACFDEKLFPFLAVAKTQPTATLHVVKNGKYLNVIGVRA